MFSAGDVTGFLLVTYSIMCWDHMRDCKEKVFHTFPMKALSASSGAHTAAASRPCLFTCFIFSGLVGFMLRVRTFYPSLTRPSSLYHHSSAHITVRPQQTPLAAHERKLAWEVSSGGMRSLAALREYAGLFGPSHVGFLTEKQVPSHFFPLPPKSRSILGSDLVSIFATDRPTKHGAHQA